MSHFREISMLVVACLVVIGGLILIFFGADGEIKALIGLVVGFYFGQYIPSPRS